VGLFRAEPIEVESDRLIETAVGPSLHFDELAMWRAVHGARPFRMALPIRTGEYEQLLV
jgi:hypothetical protein